MLEFVPLAVISGFVGLAFEVLYQRAFSLISGDLYLTYAVITLTFIAGMAMGNFFGFLLRRFLGVLEFLGGIYALGMAAFLQLGGYMVSLPTLVLILILLPPSFIIGIHVPLYAYYLRRVVFERIYFYYHLGAVVSIILLELFIFPNLPLSAIFIFLGSGQTLIGAWVTYSYYQHWFVIKPVKISLPQIITLWRQHYRYLVAIFAISLLSFYYQFSLLKFLFFYQYLVRSAFTYFIAVSVFYVALGSLLAGKIKFTLSQVSMVFLLHCLLVLPSLPAIAWALSFIRFTNMHYYLLFLDFLTFSPLLWASVFFCRVIKLTGKESKLIDFYAGSCLAVASLGNIAGYLLIALVAPIILSVNWILPPLLLTLLVLILVGKTINFSTWWWQLGWLLVGGLFFAKVYQPAQILQTGLGTQKYQFLRRWQEPEWQREKQAYTYQNYSERVFYRLEKLAVYANSLVGTFQFQYKSLPSARVYVLDGYISHPINLQQETLVGILPRRYFSATIPNSLVIGIGAGQTPAGVSLVSNHTEAVDISPAVFAFLPELSRENNALLKRADVSLLKADGSNYLKRSHKQYDLILNTATNMFTHGVAKLHTSEFLSLVKSHLSHNGVYVSWLDAQAITSEQELAAVIALQKKHFRYLDAHLVNANYILLVAYDQWRPLAVMDANLIKPEDRESDFAQQLPLTTWSVKRFLPSLPAKISRMDYPSIEINALKSCLHFQGEQKFFLSQAFDDLGQAEDN